jgi:hypothetical protein
VSLESNLRFPAADDRARSVARLPCMFSPDRRGKVRLPLRQPDRTVQPGTALGRRACSQARH